MKAKALGQNFLRNRRTARRLVHLAGGDPKWPVVDLGAGSGMITGACLDIRTGPVLAIELDERLSKNLSERFRDDSRLQVVNGDLMAAEPPIGSFVVAANPPFNASTAIVRRWFGLPGFQSGAVIVELPFAKRISGDFGASKLSLSMSPYLRLALEVEVNSSEFTPRPRAKIAILSATRRPEPLCPLDDQTDYLEFVNYLFERGQHDVASALSPLKLKLPASLRSTRVSDLKTPEVIDLFTAANKRGSVARREITNFNKNLATNRRVNHGIHDR